MQDSKGDYYFFTTCSRTMLGDPGNDKDLVLLDDKQGEE